MILWIKPPSHHNGSLGHMYGTNNGATGIPIRLVPTFQRVPTSVAGPPAILKDDPPPAIRMIPHYEECDEEAQRDAINLEIQFGKLSDLVPLLTLSCTSEVLVRNNADYLRG